MTDQTVAPAEAQPAADTAVPVTPEAAPVASVAPASAAPQRPEGLPDAYWDDAAGVKPEAFARLAELEAAETARRETVPAEPTGYKLEPSEPVLAPDGQPVTFDANDPLAQAMTGVFHKHGATQAMVADALKAFAELEMAGAKAQTEAVQAEIAKLGPEHGKRVAAVSNALTASAGAEKARALLDKLSDAASFEALEALAHKVAAPAVAAAPAQPANADLDGLRGAELLSAYRARQAG